MQYYPRNDEALNKEQNRLEKKAADWGVSAPMLYPLSGSTMVRILPPFDESGVFFWEVSKHRIRTNNNSTEQFLCPASVGQPCIVCERGQDYMDSRDEAKMKYAKDNLRPRTHYLYNVLCLSGPANRKGEIPEYGKVYVFETGIMAHRQIMSLDQDPATGWADITNPEAGVTLIVKRTGSGLDTKYEVNPVGTGGGRTNLFTELQQRGIDVSNIQLHRLNEVYTPPSAEQLQDIVASINVGTFTPAPAVRPLPVAPPAVQPVPAPTAGPAPVPVTTSGTPVAPIVPATPAIPAPPVVPVPAPPQVG